ncbi:MAG: LytTR family DNA-binding domain-containing protein [Bacteroidota bacterium]
MLNQVYPAPRPTKRSLWIALLFGVFIGGFLWYFEPFDIDLSQGRIDGLWVWGFGVISSLVLILSLYVLPHFFPSWFSDDFWRIKHQLLYWSIILLVIATGNGLYTNYLNELPFSWGRYWWIINRTFILGIIPFSFILMLDFYRRDQHFSQEAQQLEGIKNSPMQETPTGSWTIQTDLKTEYFSFLEQAFYFARAEGNYIDLYLMQDAQLTATTYRLTLSAFEKQLDSPSLMRCHRSYLVNLDKVQSVTGNAQGLKLVLEDGRSIVPVARNYVTTIKGYLSAQADQ